MNSGTTTVGISNRFVGALIMLLLAVLMVDGCGKRERKAVLAMPPAYLKARWMRLGSQASLR